MADRFHIPLAADRQAVAVELQGMLIDLLDLTLIGKHAHWNVEGPHFRSVHHELDELVEAWRTFSDEVAERVVTIGASPDGQAETIAGATQLEELPSGHLGDREVLEAIGDRLGAVVARTRTRIDRISADDQVSCDLLVEIARAMEKQLWMVQAQLPGLGNGRAAERGNGAGRS